MTLTEKNYLHYIGHSSLYFHLNHTGVMIDPLFSDQILSFLPRSQELGIDLENIPKTDALLITSTHFDHLDINAYKYFSLNTPIIIPKKTSGFIKKFIYHPLTELKPNEELSINAIKITALPSRHRGGRLSSMMYKNCNSYLLQSDHKTIFISGDTGYSDHFKKIGERFEIDLAILPISHSGLNLNSKKYFLSPQRAIDAFLDLKAKKMMPISWGSFSFPWKKTEKALTEFKALIDERAMNESIIILHPGEKLYFNHE